MKLVLLANFYPIIVLFAFKNGFPFTGSLHAYKGYYNETITSLGFYWQILGYLVLLSILLTVRKIKPYFLSISLTPFSRNLIFLGIVFFAAIAYPSVFHLSEKRFNLLPGNGWASLYNATTVLFLLSKKSKLEKIDYIHLVFTVFMIFSGSRADNILILIFVLFYKRDNLWNIEKFSFKKFILPGILLFVSGVAIGYLRFNEFEFEVFLRVLSYSIYGQGTAADAVHTYLSSIWFYLFQEPNYSVYLNTPFTFLPGTPYGGVASIYNYTQVMKNYIHNYGGGMFYAEGTMNFGFIGMVFYSLIYGLFIVFILRKRNLFSDIAFIFLFLMQLRLQWYGLLYIIKPFVMTCIFIFLIWGVLGKKLVFNSYRLKEI